MEKTYENVHPYFKLNGFPLLKEELTEVAYSLVKEGEPYEIAIGDFLLDWLNEKDTITVRTSGSTGTPKKLELRKQQMVNSALATGAFFELNYRNKVLLCLPTEFIAGKMMLVRAMVLGWELDYVPPSLNPLLGIEKHYDFVAMVPLQLQNSLEKLHLIKAMIVGGAPVPLGLRKKLAHVSTSVYETFGMTETITHIALKKISGKIVPYFKTLPTISVSKDTRDCLIINAPEIADKPIITNDVVHLITDTEFEWLGRYDTLINSGGIKLHPEAIEQKLEPLISGRYFVAGLPDPELGQKMVLFLEGKEDDNLLARLKALGTFQKFEIPREVHGVAEFVVSGNGKIQRAATIQKLGINAR